MMSAHYQYAAHETTSYYTASSCYDVQCPALPEDIEADVCIVGGGYTGLSCALHLAESGYRVVLLEAERIAWGASGRNGGHVGVGQRCSQMELERRYGETIARDLWSAGLDAVALVSELIRKHRINCDLQTGILHVAHRARYTQQYAAEVAFLRNRYGYTGATALSRSEVAEYLGSDVYYGGLCDTESLHLHPLNYALGLARAAIDSGVDIYEQSRVDSYVVDTDKVIVTTRAGSRVRAHTLVLACNGYLEDLEPKISPYIMPINNFMVATEPLGEDTANALIRERMAVQDSRFVINYWRCSDDYRLIFGGGESYRTTLPRDIAGIVQKRIRTIYPQLADADIEYAWGGTLAITMGRMPHVGRSTGNLYYAHGYSGHGVPTATYMGRAIAKSIGGDSRDLELFASLPTRQFPGGTLLRWPAMAAGMLYYSLLDRF